MKTQMEAIVQLSQEYNDLCDRNHRFLKSLEMFLIERDLGKMFQMNFGDGRYLRFGPWQKKYRFYLEDNITEPKFLDQMSRVERIQLLALIPQFFSIIIGELKDNIEASKDLAHAVEITFAQIGEPNYDLLIAEATQKYCDLIFSPNVGIRDYMQKRERAQNLLNKLCEAKKHKEPIEPFVNYLEEIYGDSNDAS